MKGEKWCAGAKKSVFLEPYDKIHGIQIPPRGVVHGDRMGRDVRFDEGPDRQLADSGGNFPAPVRYGIRLHPALRPRAHVGREPARRTAAGGRGAERRVALFPYRKHGSEYFCLFLFLT